MNSLRFLFFLSLLTAPFQGGALAGSVSVHPQPQVMQHHPGTLELGGGVQLVAGAPVDVDALTLLRETLDGVGVPLLEKASVRVIVALKADALVAEQEWDVAACSGAYRIRITPDRISLVAHDQRGLFYAVQTLRQIMEAGSTVPLLEIHDYPDIPYRGTVEGFYGKPWSHRARLRQLAFYGRYKMNTYIYGPKDDPYHSSPRWREPYPEKEAAQIRELAAAGKAGKVDFVWAVHPGKDIQWNEADDQALMKKLNAMYDLGVRSFAVFFDDISGKGTDPKRQAAILNRIHREFVGVRKDVTPLIMCPTQYNKAWSSQERGTYLDILGDELDASIHVMWTGDTVVADITRESMEWVNRRLKRKAFVWWNFPVSDYVRDHLLLGPAYGLDPQGADVISGFTSNPMDKPEASKLALYGVADYAWNTENYDSQRAWTEGLKALIPGAAEPAYALFARHNSDLGPNYHGYRRAESVELAPQTGRFLAQYRENRSLAEPYRALRKEFEEIRKAPATIRLHAANPALIEEISPWLIQFELLGDAGASALEMAGHLSRNDPAQGWRAFLAAQRALKQMERTDKTLNQNPYQPGVKTGSRVLTPFVKELMHINAAFLYGDLSGRPAADPRPVASFASLEGLEKMVDDDEASFYESQDRQAVGDYVGVDLGGLINVTEVQLLQGKDDDDHDLIHQGQLEVSLDRETWQPLGKETVGFSVTYQGPGVLARFVRYRVTHAGKLDGSKPDVWTRIRAFRVNPGPPQPRITSNHPALANTPIRIQGNEVGVSPLFEVFTLKSEQFIGVDFGEATDLVQATIDLKVDQPSARGEVQISNDAKRWHALPVQESATLLKATIGREVRHLRFVNTTGKDQEVSLGRFLIKTRTQSRQTAGAYNDQDMVTHHSESREGLRVRNPYPRAEQVTLLLSNEPQVEIMAYDANGKAHRLGTATNNFQVFSLQQLAAPVRGVVLRDTRGQGRLHEVIWREGEGVRHEWR